MKSKIILVLTIMTSIILCNLSCSKMNDVHEIYMKDGEIVYVGRVDSAHVFSGKNRMLINYWMSDPRVKQLIVYWNNKKDSVVATVPEHVVSDSIELFIGDEEMPIDQGSYTLELYSSDGNKLRSVVYEMPVNVYGDDFTATLLNRLTERFTYDSRSSELTISFYAPFAKTEVGVELSYIDSEGLENVSLINTIDLENSDETVVLKNVKSNQTISYRTLYIPEKGAIDSFYTAENLIELK